MRLIDADTLDLSRVSDSICEGQAWEAVEEAPTVDAVPVIRCYECRYFELDHFENFYSPTENGEAETVPIITAHKICRRWGGGCRTSENGYCFMAERKEE